MTRFLLVGLLLSTPAFAQYSGPAVETCRAFAIAELKREGSLAKDVVIERDQALSIQRYTRKLGSQFVSSILTGNGAVVIDGAPAAELGFICLLADEKRALFFEWLQHPYARAHAQCSRDAALRGQPRKCLETLLAVAETDLTQIYAIHFQAARERDHDAGNEKLVEAFRKANDEWRQYRDAECTRRREHAPKGFSADDYQLACQVELTRRRVQDMR
jgi:uncharacterized protein YecT (DUF1311 family)